MAFLKRHTAAVLLVAIPCAWPNAAGAYWAEVTGRVNLRSCPSTSCAALAVLPSGATVWVSAINGGWLHVSYGGVTGYAAGAYIASPTVGRSPPLPATPAPPAKPYGPGGPTLVPGINSL